MTETITPIHTLYFQLRRARPIAGLPEWQFANLLAAAKLEHVNAGAILIRQGALDRDYLVLLEGEIEIRRQYLSAAFHTDTLPASTDANK